MPRRGKGQDLDDPYNLNRFVDAQEPVYGQVCAELSRGRKTSHWMWFVFPQISGLGHSPTARKYAISGRDEAAAYARHPILGPRLRECTRLVTAIEGKTLSDIFGAPDDVKFRSSMTLFAHAGDDKRDFQEALEKYCTGEPDRMTLERL